MSRSYDMHLTVIGYDKAKADAIYDAAINEWSFESNNVFDSDDGPHMECCAEGSLCGGETEEEFARRLCKAVFKANGKPCHVSIQATYLEDLPHQDYVFDKDNLPVKPRKQGKAKRKT